MKDWIADRIQWMDANMFGTCDIVPTNDFENEPIFTVFPNPTDGILSIQLLDASPNNDSQLYLTDLLGKRVKSFPQDSNTLVISEFPNGIYFVVLEKEGQKHWKKVVKH
jgi:hypothetical protein